MVEKHFPSDRCFNRRFPGDPRFATWIIPTSDDVRSLPRKVFLSTHLLDCILQRAAPPPEPESPNFSHIGSLHTRYYMNNATNLPKTETPKLGRIERAMSSVLQHNPELMKKLIIPIVEEFHFFVLCLDVSIGGPKFIVRARFYDSLQRRTRRLKQSTMAAGIVSEVNTFFRYFVLQDKKYENLWMSDLELWKLLNLMNARLKRTGTIVDCLLLLWCFTL